MSFSRLIVVLVAMLLCLAAAVQAEYLSMTKCTDKNTCSTGCKTEQIPIGSCLPAETGMSHTFTYNPNVKTCLANRNYKGATCDDQSLEFSTGFVCSQCLPQKNGTSMLPNCIFQSGNTPAVIWNECTDSNCVNCRPFGAAAKGNCNVGGGNKGWDTNMLTGFSPCASFIITNFNSPDCSGVPASVQTLPVGDQCLEGAKFTYIK